MAYTTITQAMRDAYKASSASNWNAYLQGYVSDADILDWYNRTYPQTTTTNTSSNTGYNSSTPWYLSSWTADGSGNWITKPTLTINGVNQTFNTPQDLQNILTQLKNGGATGSIDLFISQLNTPINASKTSTTSTQTTNTGTANTTAGQTLVQTTTAPNGKQYPIYKNSAGQYYFYSQDPNTLGQPKYFTDLNATLSNITTNNPQSGTSTANIPQSGTQSGTTNTGTQTPQSPVFQMSYTALNGKSYNIYKDSTGQYFFYSQDPLTLGQAKYFPDLNTAIATITANNQISVPSGNQGVSGNSGINSTNGQTFVETYTAPNGKIYEIYKNSSGQFYFYSQDPKNLNQPRFFNTLDTVKSTIVQGNPSGISGSLISTSGANEYDQLVANYSGTYPGIASGVASGYNTAGSGFSSQLANVSSGYNTDSGIVSGYNQAMSDWIKNMQSQAGKQSGDTRAAILSGYTAQSGLYSGLASGINSGRDVMSGLVTGYEDTTSGLYGQQRGYAGSGLSAGNQALEANRLLDNQLYQSQKNELSGINARGQNVLDTQINANNAQSFANNQQALYAQQQANAKQEDLNRVTLGRLGVLDNTTQGAMAQSDVMQRGARALSDLRLQQGAQQMQAGASNLANRTSLENQYQQGLQSIYNNQNLSEQQKNQQALDLQNKYYSDLQNIATNQIGTAGNVLSQRQALESNYQNQRAGLVNAQAGLEGSTSAQNLAAVNNYYSQLTQTAQTDAQVKSQVAQMSQSLQDKYTVDKNAILADQGQNAIAKQNALSALEIDFFNKQQALLEAKIQAEARVRELNAQNVLTATNILTNNGNTSNTDLVNNITSAVKNMLNGV